MLSAYLLIQFILKKYTHLTEQEKYHIYLMLKPTANTDVCQGLDYA